jgi:hypothetical protein
MQQTCPGGGDASSVAETRVLLTLLLLPLLHNMSLHRFRFHPDFHIIFRIS